MNQIDIRPIDANALMRKACEKFYTTDYYNHISKMIEDAPTITLKPQRTGRWIPLQLSIAYPPYQCSCCFGNAPMVMVGTGRLKKGHLEALLTDFCPSCGARMEGDEE